MNLWKSRYFSRESMFFWEIIGKWEIFQLKANVKKTWWNFPPRGARYPGGSWRVGDWKIDPNYSFGVKWRGNNIEMGKLSEIL